MSQTPEPTVPPNRRHILDDTIAVIPSLSELPAAMSWQARAIIVPIIIPADVSVAAQLDASKAGFEYRDADFRARTKSGLLQEWSYGHGFSRRTCEFALAMRESFRAAVGKESTWRDVFRPIEVGVRAAAPVQAWHRDTGNGQVQDNERAQNVVIANILDHGTWIANSAAEKRFDKSGLKLSPKDPGPGKYDPDQIEDILSENAVQVRQGYAVILNVCRGDQMPQWVIHKGPECAPNAVNTRYAQIFTI